MKQQQKYINYEEDKTLTAYFKDVRKSDLLTKEKEYDLALRAQQGDVKAIHELTLANLKFVVSIAKEYQGNGLPLSDLINEGNYGMLKAAEKFDPSRGFRFISYAVWWIRQSILQSLNENSRTVRLPVNIINKIASLKSEMERFEQDNERSPIYGEILNDDGDKYDFNLNCSVCDSLNDKLKDGENETIERGANLSYDINEPREDVFTVDDRVKQELEDTLAMLDDRERDIIKCYFGIDTGCEAMTLEGIGDRYGLTKERVRQIKEGAIRKLRHNAHGLFVAISE